MTGRRTVIVAGDVDGIVRFVSLLATPTPRESPFRVHFPGLNSGRGPKQVPKIKASETVGILASEDP